MIYDIKVSSLCAETRHFPRMNLAHFGHFFRNGCVWWGSELLTKTTTTTVKLLIVDQDARDERRVFIGSVGTNRGVGKW